MDFKNSYRIEAVYFNKLKSDIDIAKSYIAAGATDEARAVLENLVDVDGAVLLLYRNIGECWAELANAIEKTKKELDALRDQQEQYHDELNEKIDEINNYIIRLINALDERLTAAEADIDDLQERMLAAESDIDNLQDRMTQAESDIDDLEANKQDKLTAGFGIEIDANNEISVDTDDVQEKLIAGQNITLTPDSTDPTKTVIDTTGGGNYPNIANLTTSYSMQAANFPDMVSTDFPCSGLRVELSQSNSPTMKDGEKNGIQIDQVVTNSDTIVSNDDLANLDPESFIHVDVYDRFIVDFEKNGTHKYLYVGSMGVCFAGYKKDAMDRYVRQSRWSLPDVAIDISGMINDGWYLWAVGLTRYANIILHKVNYANNGTTLIDSKHIKTLIDTNRSRSCKFMLNP